MIELVIGLAIFVGLLAMGLFIGGYNERQHLESMRQREVAVGDLLVTQIKSYPASAPGAATPTLLVSEVVISSDYLKTFLAGLRNIFGGEVKSFQTMLERSRAEALLRLKEQAVAQGYNALCNVRLETADLGGRESSQKNRIVMAPIIASATAYQAEFHERVFI